MTQGEFARGWKLLVLQPFGRRYRTMTDQGQPTEETIAQMQFYFQNLKWATAEAWLRIASLYAQGKAVEEDEKWKTLDEQWPTVWELRTALQAINHEYVRALPAPEPEYVPMPDDWYEQLAKLQKKKAM